MDLDTIMTMFSVFACVICFGAYRFGEYMMIPKGDVV